MNIRRKIKAAAIAAAMAGLSMGLAACTDSAGAAGSDVVESNGCSGADQDKGKHSGNSCGGVDDKEKVDDKGKADANGCGGPNGCGAAK